MGCQGKYVRRVLYHGIALLALCLCARSAVVYSFVKLKESRWPHLAPNLTVEYLYVHVWMACDPRYEFGLLVTVLCASRASATRSYLQHVCC